jgi:hypothetical protein
MPFWVTLLRALGITLGVCLVSLWGPYLVFRLWMRLDGTVGLKDLGCVTAHPAVAPALVALIFVIVLGILLLPPGWRIVAALAAVPLVVGVWLWVCRTPALLR